MQQAICPRKPPLHGLFIERLGISVMRKPIARILLHKWFDAVAKILAMFWVKESFAA